MRKNKPKYLFIGLGTMGYSMSGHLSKDPNIDLYVFNRSNRVTKRWLKDFNGFELKLSKDNKNKFNGLIT